MKALDHVFTCRSCGARILWVRGPKGGMMPVDAEPCADGELYLFASADKRVTLAAVAVPPGNTTPFDRHRPHLETCPQAARWRAR